VDALHPVVIAKSDTTVLSPRRRARSVRLNVRLADEVGEERPEPKHEWVDEPGLGIRSVGMRVAAWWEDHSRTYAGEVIQYDAKMEEYLVEYEANGSQAWHLWCELHSIPEPREERPPKKSRKALNTLAEDLADGLVSLAHSIRTVAARDRCEDDRSESNSGGSGGLQALSHVAKLENDRESDDFGSTPSALSLRGFAQTIEKEVDRKVHTFTGERSTERKFVLFQKISELVGKTLDANKGHFGPRATITSIALG